MRLAPVMLALLLALSPVAVAVQASAPAASSASPAEETVTSYQTVHENTTAVLTLGSEPTRTAFDSPSASLGSSLAMDRSEVRTELDSKTLDQQLKDADSAETKKRILNRYRYRIEDRIISLKAKERDASRAYSNGAISANQYLSTLAQIDMAAEEIRNQARVLQKHAESVPSFGMPNVDRSMAGKVLTLEGPVRDRIAKSLQGSTGSVRVYVSITDTGVALSAVTGDSYVREIVRHDRRDPSTSGSMSLGQARDLVFESYPWPGENPSGGTSTDPYGATNIYSVSVAHSHGEFTAFVDGGTKQIFKEVQSKRLYGQRTLQPGPGVQNTTSNAFGSENVTLTVNRTYAGGPLRVELTNETGAPLDGRITVAGDPVGQTGSDGVLWTLSPADQFRVSAMHEGTTINRTVVPMEHDYDSSEG